MTHPGTPRDVDLEVWLDGVGYHAPDSRAKLLGHQVTREYVASLGTMLHEVLPAGRDKAMVFSALEDVLMRANRALALGGGPADQSVAFLEVLELHVKNSPVGVTHNDNYPVAQPAEPVTKPSEGRPEAVSIYSHNTREGATVNLHELRRDQRKTLLLTVAEPGAGGIAEIELTQPHVAEELASALLSGRNKAWAPTSL